MFGAQIIPLFFQRVYDIVVVEIARQPLVAFIARNGVEIVKRFIDTSELIAYHALACSLIQGFQLVVGPVTHAFYYLQSLLVISI